MGWLVIELICPACGYEYVLVRPIGPAFPIECDRCSMEISEAPLLPGDGIWILLDPWDMGEAVLAGKVHFFGTN